MAASSPSTAKMTKVRRIEILKTPIRVSYSTRELLLRKGKKETSPAPQPSSPARMPEKKSRETGGRLPLGLSLSHTEALERRREES
jgi:hypothetical protein